MNAIILAASHERRLNNQRKEVPVFLVDLHGKPALSVLIDKLTLLTNLNEVTIITNDKNINDIEVWKTQTENKTLKIDIVNDGTKTKDEMLGAISDLCLVLKNKIKQNTLIIGGDNWFTFNLNDFVKFALNHSPAIVTTKVDNIDLDTNKFGLAEVVNNKVIHFAEKDSHIINPMKAACVYYFSENEVKLICDYENTINRLPKNEQLNKQKPGKLIEWLLNKNYAVYAWHTASVWDDMGDESNVNSIPGPNFIRIRQHVRDLISDYSTWEKDALKLLERVGSFQQLLSYLDMNGIAKNDPNLRILSALLLGRMGNILSEKQRNVVIDSLKNALYDNAMNIPSEFQSDDEDIIYVNQTAASSLVSLGYATSNEEVFNQANS